MPESNEHHLKSRFRFVRHNSDTETSARLESRGSSKTAYRNQTLSGTYAYIIYALDKASSALVSAISRKAEITHAGARRKWLRPWETSTFEIAGISRYVHTRAVTHTRAALDSRGYFILAWPIISQARQSVMTLSSSLCASARRRFSIRFSIVLLFVFRLGLGVRLAFSGAVVTLVRLGGWDCY